MSYTREQIIVKLIDYPENMRKIQLLRYELEHPATVSPDEMLETMNFFRTEAEGRATGAISNKTLYIAMNYHDEANRINAQTLDEISARLIPLEHEVNKLCYYIDLIGGQEKETLKLLYFEGKSLQEAADLLNVSIWSIRRMRDDAIDRLVGMYDFIGGF